MIISSLKPSVCNSWFKRATCSSDKKSQEDFVVRGILDGYLLYEDKIILFDYKTDRYDEPSQLITRYHGQLALYGEALSRAYSIENIDKYLILLGKDEIQVVKV